MWRQKKSIKISCIGNHIIMKIFFVRGTLVNAQNWCEGGMGEVVGQRESARRKSRAHLAAPFFWKNDFEMKFYRTGLGAVAHESPMLRGRRTRGGWGKGRGGDIYSRRRPPSRSFPVLRQLFYFLAVLPFSSSVSLLPSGRFHYNIPFCHQGELRAFWLTWLKLNFTNSIL